MADAKDKHILILGAGVTGLQTALSLLTSPSTSHYKLSIIAKHWPGDESIEYTSPWAGGNWRPGAGFDTQEVKDFEKRTYLAWQKLLSSSSSPQEIQDAETKRVGLARTPGRLFWAEHGPETLPLGAGLWWKDLVSDFQILDLENLLREEGKEKPEGAVFGASYQGFCINIPRYLAWLRESVEGLGARFIKAELDISSGLSGVVRSAKSISGIPDPVAVINACGLSARQFLPEAEASLLYPIRGQTVLVKGEAASSCTFSPASLGKEGCYVIPRPGSGTTILGGLKDAGSYEERVDPDLTTRILERVKRWKLAEELRTGEGGEFEVISEQVGWRPGRKGGPRVEVDGEGRIEGVWVVHAYGHSGGGYQGSVGSAEKVVRLVSGLVRAGSKL